MLNLKRRLHPSILLPSDESEVHLHRHPDLRRYLLSVLQMNLEIHPCRDLAAPDQILLKVSSGLWRTTL